MPTCPARAIRAVVLSSVICVTPESLAQKKAEPPLTGPDKVTLRESTITWSMYKHDVDQYGHIIERTFDGKTIVDRTFKTQILENRYLKVTLLPEFGGRILSIFYKPTGREQLYQAEVGSPFAINTSIFYLDWLMVYGGIFPTFPEAEHGASWVRPWDFKIVSETPQAITVAMTYTDNVDYPRRPVRSNFKLGATGIEATYFVTLKAGHTAVDARVLLRNPADHSISYEYWTCTTLAPGSDPRHPEATGGAEIIIADNRIRLDRLRFFKNWQAQGITYAYPNMKDTNFWGVINHDNNEGIIRVADNNITPGLKMWTWGFESFTKQTDLRKEPNERQPYIELWAGVTDEFFMKRRFAPSSEVSIPETYVVTAGLTGVTHANEHVLLNLTTEAGTANAQFVSIEPDAPVMVTLTRGEAVLYRGEVKPDPADGNQVSAPIPADSGSANLRLVIGDKGGKTLIAAEIPVR